MRLVDLSTFQLVEDSTTYRTSVRGFVLGDTPDRVTTIHRFPPSYPQARADSPMPDNPNYVKPTAIRAVSIGEIPSHYVEQVIISMSLCRFVDNSLRVGC